VLAGVAILVQVLLLFYFFVMGLGWGGSWYFANLAQALAILALAGVLFRNRPLLVLPLPVVSLLLMLAFQWVDPSMKTAAECTPAELSAAAELPPPPGSPMPVFQSELENGCIARFNSTLTGAQVLHHYRLAARKAGWKEEPPVEPAQEPPVEPGQEHLTSRMGSLDLNKDEMSFALSMEPAGEEGPAQQETWVVLSVHRRR
jgi:hypothetical protein